MKPKIYDLFTSNYESQSSYQFTHPQNKFLAEFQQDCQDILRKYTPELIKLGGGDEFFRDLNKDVEIHNTWIGVEELTEYVAKKLPELGYIPFNETFENINFGIFGSMIIKGDEYERKNDTDLINYLGTDLYQSIIDHNKIVSSSSKLGDYE